MGIGREGEETTEPLHRFTVHIITVLYSVGKKLPRARASFQK